MFFSEVNHTELAENIQIGGMALFIHVLFQWLSHELYNYHLKIPQ